MDSCHETATFLQIHTMQSWKNIMDISVKKSVKQLALLMEVKLISVLLPCKRFYISHLWYNVHLMRMDVWDGPASWDCNFRQFQLYCFTHTWKSRAFNRQALVQCSSFQISIFSATCVHMKLQLQVWLQTFFWDCQKHICPTWVLKHLRRKVTKLWSCCVIMLPAPWGYFASS